MKLKAVIVEDEEASRITLRNYISKYCSEINVVGEGSSVEEGVAVIQECRPDLVFLDVETFR